MSTRDYTSKAIIRLSNYLKEKEDLKISRVDLVKILRCHEELMKQDILTGKDVLISGICRLSSHITHYKVDHLLKVDKNQPNIVRYTLRAKFLPGIKRDMNERLKKSLKK